MVADTADEKQQWDLIYEKLDNLNLAEEEQLRAWVWLNEQKFSWVKRFMNLKPQHVNAVLREQLQPAAAPSAAGAAPSAAGAAPSAAGAAPSAAVAAPSAAAAAAGPPPGGVAGPPYRALDILHMSKYPGWEVDCCNDTTTNRSYPGFSMTKWEIEDGTTEQTEVKNYLREKLGDTLLEIDPTPQGLRQLAPLMSENDCNSKFAAFYGHPVAYIVGQCCGQRISFHLNAPTVSATGEPDFSFFVDGHTELLRGEGKNQSVMGSAATMFPALEDATLKGCARQICDYMRKTDRRYGWLTYLNGTFFIKRSSDDPHLYKFTRALPSSFADITVLEMLTYIVLKQLEEGPWQAVPTHQPAIGAQQGPHLLNTQDESSSNTTDSMTRSRAAANQQPVQGMASSSGTLHSHPDWALQISSKHLGAGQCGIVIEGRYYGEASAIKAIDLSKRYNQVSLLTNEINTYGHLTPLQGQCIPVLKGYGLWDNDNTMFLAVSVAEGEHPSRNTYGARGVAVKALRRIHEMGVLHGDIKSENIFVSKKDKDWQVWFLDFGHSSMSSDTAAQRSELQELMALFRESSD